MTSLGSSTQSLLWTESLAKLRDFKTIRNTGISFICTDREVCTKLGGISVSICGRSFKVQTYSKYSHWYYVDLQRLPDDVSDGLIYDWFAHRGTPPVYITPDQVICGLRSRNRRVYFNQKSPPPSVMLGKRTPLRQIQFTGQGFAVVHHRLGAYNRTVPPFIAALRATIQSDSKVQSPATYPLPTDGITPPAYDNDSDSDDHSSMDDVPDPDNAPTILSSSGSDSGHSGDMDDAESAITVRYKPL